MDALSEVLRVIRLDSAIFFHAEFSEPWRLTSPASKTLAPELTDRAGHVIIYHLLCEGRAFVELTTGRRVALTAGDLITFPHGHEHLLGNGSSALAVDAGETLRDVRMHSLEALHAGGGGSRSRFICGFLVCDPQLAQGFLAGLPPFIHVNLREDASGQWLENSLRFSVDQVVRRQAGSDAMLAKLSEALFAETVRRYAERLPEGERGWCAAARDPQLGQVLTLMHQRPAYPWTIAELARLAGLSRSGLNERFRQVMDESPMGYLARWRLMLAARALASTSRSAAQIAQEVGYESEAAFNRAFKRQYGLPPARYRRERTQGAA